MNHKLRKDSMTSKQRILHYLKEQKARLIVSTIFGLLFVISQMAQPFLLGLTLDYARNSQNNAFYICLGVSLGLVIIGTVFDYFFEYIVGKISQNSIKKMRNDIFDKINSISIKDFDKKYHGDLLQLEIRDMESTATGIFAVFKTLIQGVFTVVITIVMMFMVNWILATRPSFLKSSLIDLNCSKALS